MKRNLTCIENINRLSVENMWLFMEEIMPKLCKELERDNMSYEEVLQLFSTIKKSFQINQLRLQTAVLKKHADKIQLLANQDYQPKETKRKINKINR